MHEGNSQNKSPATFAAGLIPAKWLTKTNYPAKGSQETRLGHGLTQTKSSEHSLTNKHSKWTNSKQIHTKFIPNLPNLNLVHFFNKKRRMGGLLGSNHPKKMGLPQILNPQPTLKILKDAQNTPGFCPPSSVQEYFSMGT